MDSNASVESSEVAGLSGSSLILRWQGVDVPVYADEEALFGIGVAKENELQIRGQFASRFHALLRWHRNGFDLVDRSTNGVFVQLEDTQVRFIHRSSLPLWGRGYISFGEPLNKDNCLSFRNA